MAANVKMESLTKMQLTKAEHHIKRSGRGRNPISVLMELGQVLHVAPDFNIFEPDHSSIYEHVFKCILTFANYSTEAEGFNKKKVKNDAAKNMTELLLQQARSPQPLRESGDSETVTISTTQHPPYTLSELQTAPDSSDQSTEAIGNAVGNLQEYCDAKRLAHPKYTFEHKFLDGKRRKYIATVVIAGRPSVQSESIKGKANAKQLAAHKMLCKIINEAQKGAASPEAQSADDKITVEDISHLKSLKLAVEEEPTASPPAGTDRITEVLKNVNLDPSCRETLLLEEEHSASKKLEMLSESGKFSIEFHYEASPDDESHLCLVEAKIGSGLVCHGIAASQPEAKEMAAGNMLSLFRFFNH